MNKNEDTDDKWIMVNDFLWARYEFGISIPFWPYKIVVNLKKRKNFFDIKWFLWSVCSKLAPLSEITL